ncbi:hypothetical protein [Roseinatronobacter thiooxidans]|uniref:hypothetical protein n=1 Tax=Roseinatronobacter thiooxidans TaxID=121821 RepID=UPI001472AFE4|nr:hypothetical protein [Roseinatronobacter thiooxidans]
MSTTVNTFSFKFCTHSQLSRGRFKGRTKQLVKTGRIAFLVLHTRRTEEIYDTMFI